MIHLLEQAELQGIVLSFEMAPNTDDLLVDLDINKFNQVIANLIGNAFKFTPTGGRITLTVTYIEAQEKVLINVTDTGVGIASVSNKWIFHIGRYVFHDLSLGEFE